MQFTSVLMAVAALAVSTQAVTLNCAAQNLDPYCCSSVYGVPEGGFSFGYECVKSARGKKTKCPAINQQKACCEEHAGSFGPVTLCSVPSSTAFFNAPGLSAPESS